MYLYFRRQFLIIYLKYIIYSTTTSTMNTAIVKIVTIGVFDQENHRASVTPYAFRVQLLNDYCSQPSAWEVHLNTHVQNQEA